MKLILHIGTEKTASTTLQHYFYSNRDALLAQGVGLSDVCGQPNNRLLAGYCQSEGVIDNFFRARNIHNEADKAAFYEGFTENLAAEVAGLGTPVMILTSEHFHSRLTTPDMVQKLYDLLSPLFSEIQVVCYFREQAAVVKSLYSTLIKSGKDTDFKKFLKTCAPDSIRYNYADTCDLWTNVFGAENFTPRLFAKEHFVDGDICKDFIQTSGLDLNLETLKPVSANRNESLGAYGVMLGQLNNRINPRFNEGGTMNPIRSALAGVIERHPLAQQGSLVFQEAPEIHALFEESNVDFATRYLGQSENPFPAPRASGTGAPEITADDLAAFWESALEALSSLPVVSQKEVGDLRRLARKIDAGDPIEKKTAKSLRAMANRVKPRENKPKRSL